MANPTPARDRARMPLCRVGAALAIVAVLATSFLVTRGGPSDRPGRLDASALPGTHAGTRGAAGMEAPGLADVYRSTSPGGTPVGPRKSPATEARSAP